MQEPGTSLDCSFLRRIQWGIFADKSGALHLIYNSFETGGYMNQVYHMRSTDSGLTWGEPELVYQVATEVPSYLITVAAIDESGRIHMGITLRSQDYGVYSELGYMRSLDTGQTWQPYQVIAKQSEATPNVSVIAPFAFGKDEIHLTWHDPRRMHMWSSNGGVTWSKPIEIIQLGAGFGGANFLAKDSAGVLRAATGVANGVYVSTFANSQWGAAEQIENRNMDPHSQILVVCQGNQLNVMYDDRVKLDTTVWYAHKEVDAPHLERSPIPTPQARSATISASPEAHQASPTAEPAATSIPTRPLTAVSSQAISERVGATPGLDGLSHRSFLRSLGRAQTAGTMMLGDPAKSRTRLNAMEAMLDRVLSNLPGSLSTLRAERRTLLARCFAEMAFLAALNGETGLARRCAYRGCVAAPEWLHNRGLLKILITGGRHLWPEPIVW